MTGLLGQMGCERHTAGERERCAGEHWVTLLLNLSTSKVSPPGWGLDGRGGRGGRFRGKREGEK